MPRHTMIDIETAGTAVDSLVLSVGACQFVSEGRLARTMHRRIELDSQLRVGRKPSADTLSWWMDQSADARQAAWDKQERIHVSALAAELAGMVDRNTIVWARGPQFDIAILESLFSDFRVTWPWRYNNVRDSRTFLDSLSFLKFPERPGVAHNALDDACYEADCVILGLQFLNQFQRLGDERPDTALQSSAAKG